MRFALKPLHAAILIALAAQLLFTLGIHRPAGLVFDEVHYVPAARTLLTLSEPVNTEHPLMGKMLIGAGIALFGDNPIGWRAMSTLAGTLTVLGGFAILWMLFARIWVAALGAGLLMLNQTLFVQARIGMLDGFLGAFLTLGIAALIWALTTPPPRRLPRLALAGALFGLAVATKWAAIPYVAAACLLLLATQPGRAQLTAPLAFGTAALAVYFASFTPAFFYWCDPLAPADLVAFQFEMYAQQTKILSDHPYQSDWWSWPLMLRPIWYFYEPDQGIMRGILLIGNPVVMWGGLVAVAACLWAGWRGSRAHLALAALWILSLAIFAIIPKSLGFYYYYHLSGIFIALALAAALALPRSPRPAAVALGAAVIAFAYFHPIVSGAALVNNQAFNHWMWFDSWR
ncbi:glycosyltransferase family 39 protein [Sphingomonas baiyangensis]|uniref:Polyprenol-phosphate-mannose--protein mannosyltransferase n=1 Tax=Sphingomonas baiyangensis TaxID=2572576 RepID=A0A4U1L1T0_9SPHN|nr:glycosyltransferase family 39 protein [Sphingomonas baiyangensis]TKD50113.1 phospholipid carrier-dependent glycosyltransferase [Sphingomonas baiyangensis]